LVPDYFAQEAGQNRFLGRSPLPPFAPLLDSLMVESRPEYLQHLRQGDLIPVDRVTAVWAGLSFLTPKDS
jgi:hypothetical protein